MTREEALQSEDFICFLRCYARSGLMVVSGLYPLPGKDDSEAEWARKTVDAYIGGFSLLEKKYYDWIKLGRDDGEGTRKLVVRGILS